MLDLDPSNEFFLYCFSRAALRDRSHSASCVEQRSSLRKQQMNNNKTQKTSVNEQTAKRTRAHLLEINKARQRKILHFWATDQSGKRAELEKRIGDTKVCQRTDAAPKFRCECVACSRPQLLGSSHLIMESNPRFWRLSQGTPRVAHLDTLTLARKTTRSTPTPTPPYQ